MEIRNNYTHSVAFGTMIPTNVRNKLVELIENPNAKMRARKDRKKILLQAVANKIEEIENSNSNFFELTIMKNNKGKDCFGLKGINESSTKQVEVMTCTKRNLLAKFLSITPQTIRRAEQAN